MRRLARKALPWPNGAARERQLKDSLQKIFEIGLGAEPSSDPENVHRHTLRVEFDKVTRSMPNVARAGDQIVHLEGMIGIDVELAEPQIDEARMSVVRTEVYHYQNGVGAIGRLLAVTD